MEDNNKTRQLIANEMKAAGCGDLLTVYLSLAKETNLRLLKIAVTQLVKLNNLDNIQAIKEASSLIISLRGDVTTNHDEGNA